MVDEEEEEILVEVTIYLFLKVKNRTISCYLTIFVNMKVVVEEVSLAEEVEVASLCFYWYHSNLALKYFNFLLT